MALDLLVAQYPKQQVVRDRNYSGLLGWAASVSAQAVPSDPAEGWVRLRIIADRIPAQTANYVERTLSYFVQDPTTATNIREYLSEWNDEAAEAALSAQIAGVIGAFMPRFALLEVSDADVQSWLEAHQ